MGRRSGWSSCIIPGVGFGYLAELVAARARRGSGSTRPAPPWGGAPHRTTRRRGLVVRAWLETFGRRDLPSAERTPLLDASICKRCHFSRSDSHFEGKYS